MANGFDLGSLIDMFGSLSQAQAEQTQQIADMQAQQGERAEIQAEATREAGQLTARANLTARRAEMEAVNNARRNATSLGTNAADVGEIITGLNEQLRADALAFQAASTQVQQIEENSNLLSNPLGWLNDVLNGDEARARRDNIQERHDTTARQLSNMHALAQTNVQTQLSIAETQTEASINQLAKAEALQAEVDAQARSIEALSYTAASIDTLRQHGAAEFNRRMQLSSEIRAQERFQKSMALQRQQFELQQKKFAAEERELDSWQTTVESVNIARQAMNIEPMDEGTIIRVYDQNTPMGNNVRELEWMGHVMQNRDVEVRIGDTPAESYSRINRFGANLPPVANPAMEILDATADRVQATIARAEQAKAQANIGFNEYGITTQNFDRDEVQAAAFNTIARELTQEQAVDQSTRPLPITNILTEFPALADMPLTQKIINPMIEAGETELTPVDISVRAATMYANNKLTHNEARDGIVQLFESALALDNAYSWKAQMGLPVTDRFVASLPEGSERVREGRGVLGTTTGLAESLRRRNYTTTNRRVIENSRILTDPTDVSTFLNSFKSSTLAERMRSSAER